MENQTLENQVAVDYLRKTSQHVFKLRHNQEEDAQIWIIDNIGRLIHRLDIELIDGYVLKTLDMSGYPLGIYQIVISTSFHKYTHKIIKK